MVFSFAGTIAHFMNDDWELVEQLIYFHHMGDKEHAGAHAAKAFVKSAADCSGLKKMSLFTLDIINRNLCCFTAYSLLSHHHG